MLIFQVSKTLKLDKQCCGRYIYKTAQGREVSIAGYGDTKEFRYFHAIIDSKSYSILIFVLEDFIIYIIYVQTNYTAYSIQSLM